MDKSTTFAYWVTVAQFSRFKMQRFSRPAFVGNTPTPENLDDLTIGQLIQLSDLKGTNESLYQVTEIVLGLDRATINNSRAVDVVRFVGWIFGEVQKINKLFSKEDVKPTQREKQAGIDTLRFGLFGMLDWYAIRMGISDHDTVLQVPWMRIYKCMDMDNKKRAYEIRLQKIASEEMKRNSKVRRR